MGEQRFGIGFQIARGPVPRLRERGIQRLTHDDDLAAIELAHTGGHNVDVDLLAASWPARLHKVLRCQVCQIVAQLLPAPPLLRRFVGNAQPTVALEASRDEEVPFTCGVPQAFGTVPTIQQHVRSRPDDWLELANERFHQLDLALERHLFGFTHLRLPVQLRSQRAPTIQQDVESLNQAVADDALVMGGRMMLAQTFHLAPFRFAHGRVIPNDIPGHEGLFPATSALGLSLALLFSFDFHQRLHLFPEMLQPDDDQRFLNPRGDREKPAQSTQAGRLSNLAHDPPQRALAFALQQPQQYGHEVLILRLAEHRAKTLGKVTDFFIQAYNGLWHRTPLWFQGFLVTCLIPHRVLSCYPFPKVQT